MGGYGKFFFGGLLGALFGFLVSPKRGQKVRDVLMGGSQQQMGQGSTRLLQSPAPPPEPFDWREAAPAIIDTDAEVDEEPEAEPEAELEADLEFAPEAGEEAEKTATWEAVAHEGLSEEPIEVPEYEPQQRPADMPGEVLAQGSSDEDSEAAGPEPAEPEPPQAAEELQVEQSGFSTEESAAYSEEPPEEELPIWTVPVDDEEIEALSASAPEGAPEEAQAPAAEPEPPHGLEPETELSTAVASEPEPEPAPEPEPELEAAPEPNPEPAFEAAPEPAPEPEPATVTSGAIAPADLKARIEETRRRIQQELEQPFAEAESPSPVSFEPPREEDFLAEPSADAPKEDEVESAEAVPAVSFEPPSEPEDSTPTGAPALDPATGEFDQEAMRRRIEETRSRLKAKAFDAMMSGEGALLGRDEGKGAPVQGTKVHVDTEVDHTIESTLTEEEF